MIISNAYSIYTLKNSKTRIEKVKEKMDYYSVNIDAVRELVFSKMVGMQVFMEYDATDEQIYELRENLNKINGVYNVTFVSKEEAYNIMKNKLGERQKAIEVMKPDIFAVSFTIETSKKKEDKVYKQIQKLPYVREITSTGETSSSLENPITILSILVLDKYNEILIYSMIMLVTRTILSICILGSIYRDKEELTINNI